MALGLVIIFGQMGVINMAHGKFMILGTYVTYLMSSLFSAYIPGFYGIYFFVAMIFAFLASGALGLSVERGMIRDLYKRPLDTLLATWGLSLISCLPDRKMLDMWNTRKTALFNTDPERVPPLAALPNTQSAHVGAMKGDERDKAATEAARTVPPRELRGNCDIKDLSRGSVRYFWSMWTAQAFRWAICTPVRAMVRSLSAGPPMPGGRSTLSKGPAMPVYEYLCHDCGVFEEMMPMSRFAGPCDCPDCSTAAPRVMLSVPALSAVTSANRRAHETGERGADSPKRTSTHGPGCGCCSGGSTKSSKTLYRPDGSKSFPTKRPWMISH